MDGSAKFVASPTCNALAGTAYLVAVLNASGRSIVSRRQQPLVLDEERSHLVSEAGGPLGDYAGDLHEVLIQVRPVDS
jgi:hypothetical protein